jgi:uncharacterized membrane protein
MAKHSIGNKLAPPRFLLFLAILLVGVGAAFIYHQRLSLGILAAFDVAALVFLISILPMLRTDDEAKIRQQAARNDANRGVLLAITGVVTTVVLVAIAAESSADNLGWGTKALIIATIILAWLFSNLVYAVHYAHMAYGDGGDECRSLDFPKTETPVYSDFVYFAFTLGMTFQTSDVQIQDQSVRRVVVAHSLAAFFFNIGVLAFTINVLGSSH